jgi:hypothetical protein
MWLVRQAKAERDEQRREDIRTGAVSVEHLTGLWVSVLTIVHQTMHSILRINITLLMVTFLVALCSA